jgi:amino acid adenylation domain-containing protein
MGVARNELVGIFCHRGFDYVIAALAVLKAGAAFVPLDPVYPKHRIRYMMADSEIDVLLSTSSVIGEYMEETEPSEIRLVVCMDELPGGRSIGKKNKAEFLAAEELMTESIDNPTCVGTGKDLAYMLYTSGSTGAPKGALIRHEGMINHIYAKFAELRFGTDSAFMQNAPASSDISIWQFMAPLLSGGRTVIADYETACDPVRLFQLVQFEGVTALEMVPALFKPFLDYCLGLSAERRLLPALEWLMATGEALPVNLARQWFDLYPEIPLVNAYGPTEASDDVCQTMLRAPLAAHTNNVPIGRPLANLKIYVLDLRHGLVPVGVPGEICVSGIGVGAGYWRKPEKTRESFVENPYGLDQYTRTMYRTGDLGRWLPSGELEFLGRMDGQVKLRGFRIELGEIEATLAQHPQLRECVVVVREDLENERRLVGYFTTRTSTALSHVELRNFLKEKLPEHMVPSFFMQLECLPLLPNGKADRKTLPAPSMTLTVKEEPQTETEKEVAKIWKEILKLDQVGLRDNFFEMGGHSLLATQLTSRLRDAFGVELPLRSLFESPTVAEIANHLEIIRWNRMKSVGLGAASEEEGTI